MGTNTNKDGDKDIDNNEVEVEVEEIEEVYNPRDAALQSSGIAARQVREQAELDE